MPTRHGRRAGRARASRWRRCTRRPTREWRRAPCATFGRARLEARRRPRTHARAMSRKPGCRRRSRARRRTRSRSTRSPTARAASGCRCSKGSSPVLPQLVAARPPDPRRATWPTPHTRDTRARRCLPSPRRRASASCRPRQSASMRWALSFATANTCGEVGRRVVARGFPPSREASADRRRLGGGGQARDRSAALKGSPDDWQALYPTTRRVRTES